MNRQSSWARLGPKERRGTNTYFLCRCICGTERWVSHAAFINGMSKSCGCSRQLQPDRRFGRLTIVARDNTLKKYLCKCDCGNTQYVRTGNLTSGSTISCGCWRENRLKIENAKSYRPEYAIWREMLQRCNNPNRPQYSRYGGRGIKVCERWFKFDNFFLDMGERPKGLTLERIDNDKGYGPDNCKWASRYEQTRNRKVTRIIEFDGQQLTIPEWAIYLGINKHTLDNRIKRGWTLEKALIGKLYRPPSRP